MTRSDKTSPPSRRLWGIDVIGSVYGVATLLFVWLFLNGSPTGRMAAVILGPVCAALSIGMFRRINATRVALLVLLSIAFAGDGLFVIYYLCAAMGVVGSPENKEPLPELARMPLRIGLTLAMFLYLRRSDVRQAFVRRSVA
jgi:hypothetical protein